MAAVLLSCCVPPVMLCRPPVTMLDTSAAPRPAPAAARLSASSSRNSAPRSCRASRITPAAPARRAFNLSMPARHSSAHLLLYDVPSTVRLHGDGVLRTSCRDHGRVSSMPSNRVPCSSLSRPLEAQSACTRGSLAAARAPDAKCSSSPICWRVTALCAAAPTAPAVRVASLRSSLAACGASAFLSATCYYSGLGSKVAAPTAPAVRGQLAQLAGRLQGQRFLVSNILLFRLRFRVQGSCTHRAGERHNESWSHQEVAHGTALSELRAGGCTRSGGRRRARAACQSSHSSSVDSRHLAVAAASSGASAGSVRFTAAGCGRHGVKVQASRNEENPKPHSRRRQVHRRWLRAI